MKNIFHPISWKIREIYVSIRNFIKWFPVIWQDRDWDFTFTYDVIKFKMEQQAKYLKKRGMFQNTQAYVDHANTISKLIDMHRNGYYGMEYFDHHETEWEFIELPDKPEYKQLEIHVTSENFNPYFEKYSRAYKQILAGKINLGFEVNVLDRKEVAFAISQYNEQRCQRILFKMLEHNLENLWD